MAPWDLAVHASKTGRTRVGVLAIARYPGKPGVRSVVEFPQDFHTYGNGIRCFLAEDTRYLGY